MNRTALLLRSLPAACDAAVSEAARLAAALARQTAPVRTGRLRASVVPSGSRVLSDCPYAAYVELGTRFAPAQPFLLPSARAADLTTLLAIRLREVLR